VLRRFEGRLDFLRSQEAVLLSCCRSSRGGVVGVAPPGLVLLHHLAPGGPAARRYLHNGILDFIDALRNLELFFTAPKNLSIKLFLIVWYEGVFFLSFSSQTENWNVIAALASK
jgi:hypothetical protein